MPRKYKLKRRRRKRRVPRPVSGTFNTPLPQTILSKHRYSAAIQLDPGAAGIMASHVFSANGLYDPDITGTGHQPMGFDQLTPLYDHYTVIAAKITVKSSNPDTTYQQILGINTLDDTTDPASGDVHTMIEQGKCKYIVFADDASSGSKSVSSKVSVKKFFGKSNMMDNAELKGNAAANPLEQVYFHVVAAPIQGVNSTPMQCLVVIEYIAVWSEPKALTSS